MELYCPICTLRISESAKARGETIVVKHVPLVLAHKGCLVDYISKYGKEYKG